MTPRGRAFRALKLAGQHRATALLALHRMKYQPDAGYGLAGRWAMSCNAASMADLSRTRRDALAMAREWVEEAHRIRTEEENRRGGWACLELAVVVARGAGEVLGARVQRVHEPSGWAVV